MKSLKVLRLKGELYDGIKSLRSSETASQPRFMGIIYEGKGVPDRR